MEPLIRGVGMLLALVVTVTSVCRAAPARTELTHAGKPTATIVVAEHPTTSAAFAAAELQDHVRRITGARLPIVADTGVVSGTRILVGESTATRKQGLTSGGFRSGEYLVRVRPRLLVLLGRDKAEAAQLHDPDPTFVPGKFGKALNFDGTNNILALPQSGFSDDEGTLEAWVWLPPKAPSQEGTIFRLDSNSPWTYHIVGQAVNTRQIYYRVYDGKTVHIIESPQLEPGWHHVVATHSVQSGKIALFVDNVSIDAAPYLKTQCRGCVLYMGAAPTANAPAGNLFAGKIDEVRVSSMVRDVLSDAAGGPYTADKGTTLLLHCDGPATAGLTAHNRVDLSQPPDYFDEHGTLNAVYDFLERDCGVRWYAPTEVGMVYAHTPTLTVSPQNIRRSPAMPYTWITPTPLYMPTKAEAVSPGEVKLWKLRMRLGGKPYNATHSFYGFDARFRSTHPDWFSGGQMCYTNPGFIHQVVQDADGFFEGKGLPPGSAGMGDFYALVPMDNNDWGPCAQGLLDPSDTHQFFNGRASRYVWTFVNTVAQEVGKAHPNKYLTALAYWDYSYPPPGITLAPNVAVQLCLPMRDEWNPSEKANNREIFRRWTQDEGRRPIFLWLYYNFPGMNGTQSHFNDLPGFYAHTIVQQMKLYHHAGIRGIFMEHSSEFQQSYLQDQLEIYLTLRLADDPILDGNALIQEFFTRYYGAAAVPMRELYDGIEAVYSDPKNYPKDVPNGQTEEIAWGNLGTAPRMARWGSLMSRATALARTPDEKTRVAYFKAGIWDPMVAGREAYIRKATASPGQVSK